MPPSKTSILQKTLLGAMHSTALSIVLVPILLFVSHNTATDPEGQGTAFAITGWLFLATPLLFILSLLTMIHYRKDRNVHFWFAVAYLTLLITSHVWLAWITNYYISS